MNGRRHDLKLRQICWRDSVMDGSKAVVEKHRQLWLVNVVERMRFAAVLLAAV